MPRDKAVGLYGTLGDMQTSNSPTVIAGNIASDSHSLPLYQQNPVSSQPQQHQIPVMAEQQHSQLHSGFSQPQQHQIPVMAEQQHSQLHSGFSRPQQHQIPVMAEQQHSQLHSGFSNPSDVYCPDEVETGDNKHKSEFVIKRSS